jgi:uncharacterized protein
VIDRRRGGGGGGGGLPVRAGGGLGLVGVIVFLAVQLLGGGGGGAAFDIPAGFEGALQAPEGEPIPRDQDPDRDLRDFSAFVFSDAQDLWAATLGSDYRRAKLVLYSGRTSTACGAGSAAMGPFYCPGDERVYLDLSFYRDMEAQLGAGGDFAWAYVIGHEVGHHVQHQVGTNDDVARLSRENPGDANQLSVRQELQADCYAGVWARSVFDQLEDGDVEEAMRASEAVGDDRLQRQAGQRVNPDALTHGTSAQRLRWFRTGTGSGRPADCDTFSGDV